MVLFQVCLRFTKSLIENGEVYLFGKGKFGALGNSSQKNISYTTPWIVEYFTKHKIKIKDVAIGENHSIFVATEGTVYTCGYGGKPSGLIKRLFTHEVGALGHNNISHQHLPTTIESLVEKEIKIKEAAAGRYHSVVLAG